MLEAHYGSLLDGQTTELAGASTRSTRATTAPGRKAAHDPYKVVDEVVAGADVRRMVVCVHLYSADFVAQEDNARVALGVETPPGGQSTPRPVRTLSLARSRGSHRTKRADRTSLLECADATTAIHARTFRPLSGRGRVMGQRPLDRRTPVEQGLQ